MLSSVVYFGTEAGGSVESILNNGVEAALNQLYSGNTLTTQCFDFFRVLIKTFQNIYQAPWQRFTFYIHPLCKHTSTTSPNQFTV